ncbi:MAG: NADH:ubiquinone reductase (Na(+)-transporting) subunit C [Bacteroidales bacterium]|jgi:Na+-transporting NADH:ubiquinone oxidoreductase subunit C|nr:NADH:ubiquinone reductase (Na(+)-transporting) subunit C [Bacteroidales bacterium]
MDKNSNTYIFIYAVLMVVIVAAMLSFVATKLKPFQDFNEEVQKKQDILKAIQVDSNAKTAVDLYNKYIVGSRVVNSDGDLLEGQNAFKVDLKKEISKPVEDRSLPIFVSANDDGSTKLIIPLQGKGLWGPIWGYISLNDDMKTIYGASFDHKSETPGLGAEINTEKFQEQFLGKKILDENQEFVSVKVVKGGAENNNPHAVDAISGGTITSDGLEDMMFDCLKPYMNYFERVLTKGGE